MIEQFLGIYGLKFPNPDDKSSKLHNTQCDDVQIVLFRVHVFPTEKKEDPKNGEKKLLKESYTIRRRCE